MLYAIELGSVERLFLLFLLPKGPIWA